MRDAQLTPLANSGVPQQVVLALWPWPWHAGGHAGGPRLVGGSRAMDGVAAMWVEAKWRHPPTHCRHGAPLPGRRTPPRYGAPLAGLRTPLKAQACATHARCARAQTGRCLACHPNIFTQCSPGPLAGPCSPSLWRASLLHGARAPGTSRLHVPCMPHARDFKSAGALHARLNMLTWIGPRRPATWRAHAAHASIGASLQAT